MATRNSTTKTPEPKDKVVNETPATVERKYIYEVTRYPHCAQKGYIYLGTKNGEPINHKEAETFIMNHLKDVQWEEIKVFPDEYIKNEVRISPKGEIQDGKIIPD